MTRTFTITRSGITRRFTVQSGVGPAGPPGTTDYNELTNKPTLGTASALDVAATGDAAAGEVVKGDDTRLTDARTPTVHTHVSADITDASDNAIPSVIAKYTSSSRFFTLGLDLYNGSGSTTISSATGSTDYTITVPAVDGTLVVGGGTASGTNTGDQTITLTGDVTGSGTGSFTATIANDAVTFAKMQEISSTSLIGRHGGGTGNPQEVSVGNGIEFQGSGIRRSALTGDVTASAGSNTTTLASVGTAGTYQSVTTDAKGRVTAGTNPTTLSGYGITDAASLTASETIAGDKTISGVTAFSSTTRPTSSGTGTPASNSLITLADGDSRYGSKGVATTSTVSITNNDTPQTIRSFDLQPGTYYVRMYFRLLGTDNTGTRHGYNFSGSAIIRFNANRASSLTATQLVSSSSNLGLNEAITTAWIEGMINVSAAGTLEMQAAQRTSHADTLTVGATTFLVVTPCFG